MKTSDKTDELIKALLAAQKEFPPIPKTRQGQLGNRKYMYADINDILDLVKPVLHKHGLVLQHGMESNGHSAVTCRLSHVSGQWQQSSLKLSDNLTAQALGSEITYERRYTGCAMLGIATEDDDDGAAASEKKRTEPPSHAAPEGTHKSPQASPSPAKRKEPVQSGPAHRGQVVEVYPPKSTKGPHGIKVAYEGIEKSHNTFSLSAVENARAAIDRGLEVEFTFYDNEYNGKTYQNILSLKMLEPGSDHPEDDNIPFGAMDEGR